jgi:hypothetical protein
LPRRTLDDIWDGGAVRACLERGQWNFAMRTALAQYSPSVEPSFGYRRAFDKPTDWVRTCGLCSDEYFRSPLNDYRDEAGFWYADLETIYVRFVSDAAGYGNDLSLWPESFVKCVELYLASEACETITQSQTKQQKIDKDLKEALIFARSKDAMDEGTMFPPPGRWSSARMAGGRRLSRGSRGTLLG